MTNSKILTRARAALQLSFIADALAMPVHWFYNPQDIYTVFPGGVKRFEAAPPVHPISFMSLPSTNEDNSSLQVVGDIILKGKREYWGSTNQHYHRGMIAGENTLNLHCMRVLIRSIAHNNKQYDVTHFLHDYIQFMTADTPQHPDTYAEAYHRTFFTNLAKGIPPEKAATRTEDSASIGGLVGISPIALTALMQKRDLAHAQLLCRTHLFLTHPDEHLAIICDAYVALIDSLLFRETEDVRTLIAATAKQSAGIDVSLLAKQYQDDNDVVGKLFSRACPINDSWPSLLYLAWKYSDNPLEALIANTHLGGDNCHRGAVLGVILGLATQCSMDNWFMQLTEANAIKKELDDIL